MAAGKAGAGTGVGGRQDSRDKAVKVACEQIEKQFGKGAIMRLGEAPAVQIGFIPTGSLALDAALGIGGIPRGRVVEFYGPESAGKTMLALHTLAEAQRRGGVTAFVDAEHALDVAFASRLGVDVENLLVAQPDCGEEALEITDTLVRSGAIDLVVVDSVAALVPKSELEGEMGESYVGLQARLMSQALRKLTGTAQKTGTTVLFINQLRMKIGVMFGSPETTTGGRALAFYASVRLDIRGVGAIKDGDEMIGRRTRVKVVKNKVAPPFRKVELEIMFGKGISASGSLLDAALKYDIIQKSGSWYSYGEERIGQGRENAKQFLESNSDIASSIEATVRGRMFPELPTDQGEQGNGDSEAGKAVADSEAGKAGTAAAAGSSSAGSKAGGDSATGSSAGDGESSSDDELF